MIDLYKNIEQRRKELKLSQDELAKKVGYTDRSMISKIEAGEVDLTRSKILAFAAALNVKPGDLMGWCDKTMSVPGEDELIEIFRSFGLEGREKILDYARLLRNDGSYIKNNADSVV